MKRPKVFLPEKPSVQGIKGLLSWLVLMQGFGYLGGWGVCKNLVLIYL